MEMPRVPETKAGQWLGRFPNDEEMVLAYGYRFYPPGRGNGAFRSSYSTSSVYVYAVIEVWRKGQPKPTRVEILEERAVGKARLVRDADKVGRKGVRDFVRPALEAYFAQENPPHLAL